MREKRFQLVAGAFISSFFTSFTYNVLWLLQIESGEMLSMLS